MFSLVGIPPLSGFWPKIYLLQSTFTGKDYWLLGAILFGSFMTLFVIAKIWAEVFWKSKPEKLPDLLPQPIDEWSTRQKWMLISPVVLLAVVSLFIGFGAEQIIQISTVISQQLADTSTYVESVLGEAYLKSLQP